MPGHPLLKRNILMQKVPVEFNAVPRTDKEHMHITTMPTVKKQRIVVLG